MVCTSLVLKILLFLTLFFIGDVPPIPDLSGNSERRAYAIAARWGEETTEPGDSARTEDEVIGH